MAEDEIIDIDDEIAIDETEDDVNDLEETNVIDEPAYDPTIPDVTEDDGTPEDPTAPEDIEVAEGLDNDTDDIIDADETNDLTEYEIAVEEQEVDPLIDNQVVVSTIGNVQEGERVMLAMVDGELTVVGTVGSGDRQQEEINEAASAAASAVESAAIAETAAQTASTQAASAQASATAANEHLKSVVSDAITVEKAVSVMQTALESIIDLTPWTTQQLFQGDGTTTTFDLNDEATNIDSVQVDGVAAEYTSATAAGITTVTLGTAPANQAVVSIIYEHKKVQEYFWHDANGAHVLGNTTGYRNDVKSTGMEVTDVTDEKAVAKFGASGVQIGKDDGSHIVQTSTSFKMADNENQSFFEVVDLKGANGQATIQENVKIMLMASTHPIQYNSGGWTTILVPHIATTFFIDEIVSLTIDGTDISDISEVTFENSHREATQTSYNQLNVDFDYLDSDSNASRFLNTTELAEGVTIVDNDPSLEITEDNSIFVIMRKITETHPGGWVTLPAAMVSDYVVAPTGNVQVTYTNAVITYKTSDSNMQSLTFGSRNPDAGKGKNSTSLGQYNSVTGDSAFGSGLYVEASGLGSHAEGNNSKAQGDFSHAEGANTTANGRSSHAEGLLTFANGNVSHAEGERTVASGYQAHAEGSSTTASGNQSHAEGAFTKASGPISHAGNWYTLASGRAQTVIGMFNEESPAVPATKSHRPMSDFGVNAFIIGNGTSETARSNAFEVDWVGNVTAAGGADLGGDIYLDDGHSLYADAAELDATVTPSADKYISTDHARDVNGNEIGHSQWVRTKDGELAHNWANVRNYENGSWVWRQCDMRVDGSGNAAYTIYQPAAFCEALHVGDRVTKDQSTAVSIADSSWKNICSISLAAGTWVIEATGQYAANATGRRYLAISESSASASAAVQRQTANSMNAVSGGTTFIHTGCTKVLSATTTIYLVGWQNSGGALNTYGCITAVRIK